ncbi:MAG: heparan-alpha-glucosaminide N-acetyltransferase domain-containing protein [Planctomycetota bacterium]
MTNASSAPTNVRITSLDQFRGYTVAGMFVVNFLGGYASVPYLLRHKHDYCSYADTIMPQFLFAVGFAFRLTFERRVQKEGLAVAYGRAVRRLLGLALLAMVVYRPGAAAESWEQLREIGIGALEKPLKREWFQTLMHIAVTSLWILPVIRSSAVVRVGFAAVSGILHVLLSHWFNFYWINSGANGIDGGPLGFLTWSIPALIGTLACDAVTASAVPRPGRMVLMGILLMASAWLLSCGTRLYDVPEREVEARKAEKLAGDPVFPGSETLKHRPRGWLLAEPPFVPPPDAAHRKWNYWMMSQRAGTLTYTLFSGGLALFLYAGFYIVCDGWGLRLRLFETLGTNALAGYILHSMVDGSISAFVPNDSPGWYVAIALMIYFGITWLMVWTLERNRIFLRL